MGIVVIVVVIVVAVLVIGGVFVGIGKGTRREERRGTVHPPDDPQRRPPRA
jgi:hypothetical protein